MLKRAVAKAGVTLEKLLLTHGHMDHCGLAGVLADELACRSKGRMRATASGSRACPPQGAHGAGGKSFEPTRWLNDGDTVTVGELTLDVCTARGIRPAMWCFSTPSRLAIVGDVLFQGSIGRTDFPKGNHQQLLDSITEKLWPLGKDVTFIPGHGPCSTFGHEMLTNPFVGSRYG
jgi:glyoxylase-like metal-dependent hydrolase (beta-lactamase superfamily II)